MHSKAESSLAAPTGLSASLTAMVQSTASDCLSPYLRSHEKRESWDFLRREKDHLSLLCEKAHPFFHKEIEMDRKNNLEEK